MNYRLLNPIPTGVVLRRLLLATGLLLISACVSNGSAVRLPSENHNSRVNIIVIHHTTANFEESVNILTQPSSNSVSSHYLVPEPVDATYAHRKLKVFELVPESQRAWHAGRSYWGGKTGLNDQSIGIELVNQTYCNPRFTKDSASDTTRSPRRMCFYPDFAESQIDILIDLLHEILARHPDIKPTNIVGHADIAPGRKIDPGPRFPWQRLYQLGIGAWFDDATVTRYWERFVTDPVPLVNVQRALRAYGYDIEDSGAYDEQTHDVLRAFQMHFRPSTVTGTVTLESTAILYALIEKYRPDALDELLEVDSPDPLAPDTVELHSESEAESTPAATQ